MTLFYRTALCTALVFLTLSLLMPAAARAQAAPPVQAEGAAAKKEAPLDPKKAAAEAKKAARDAEKRAQEEEARIAAELAARPPFSKSLLFTALELDTVHKAEAGRNVQSTKEIESVELIPVDRKIWLQGIYYQAANNWIIWLNGYKLTPYYMLPEIRGIRVDRDRVYLEWYDIGKNGIINISLQPHQVYDIVTGILVWDTDGGAKPSSGKSRTSRRPRR